MFKIISGIILFISLLTGCSKSGSYHDAPYYESHLAQASEVVKTCKAMNADFVKTFLRHYEQGGRLTVWELAANETDCMIGNHSIPVIADAYAKGIRNFDLPLAMKAMQATVSRNAPDLNAFRSKGLIEASDAPESVSKTLELAYDDWKAGHYSRDPFQDMMIPTLIEQEKNWQPKPKAPTLALASMISASINESSRLRLSIIVTRTPNAAKIQAYSMPMTPAPTTANVRGRWLSRRMSSLIKIC